MGAIKQHLLLGLGTTADGLNQFLPLIMHWGEIGGKTHMMSLSHDLVSRSLSCVIGRVGGACIDDCKQLRISYGRSYRSVSDHLAVTTWLTRKAATTSQ